MTSIADAVAATAVAAPWNRARPVWRRTTLACGLRLAVAPTDFPVVRLRMAFPAGAEREPRGLEGLASLATPLLRAGTARRDGAGLAAATERLGADLVTAYDWETGSLTLDVLVEDFDEALDLLLETALAPAFPAPSCERMTKKRRWQLRQRLEQPASLAADALARSIFVDDRYGRSLLGTPEGLAAVDVAELLRFHRAAFGLTGAALVVVGGVDDESVARRLEAALGRAPVGPAGSLLEPAAAGVAPGRTGPEVRVYDVPRAAQVDLQIGHVGVAQGDPDLFGLQVLNAVLAGGPLGWLTRELRRRGTAYFVHSRFVARRGPGPFFIATTVRPDQAARAVGTALDALRRLLDGPIPAGELEVARRSLEAALRHSFEAPTDVADRLTHLESFALPDDHYATGLAAVRSLSAESLLAIARRHLDPERVVIVAVGPARRLARSLDGFGPRIEEPPAAVDRPHWTPSFDASPGTAGGAPPSLSDPRGKEVIQHG